jgi:hypothetical protein
MLIQAESAILQKGGILGISVQNVTPNQTATRREKERGMSEQARPCWSDHLLITAM